MPPRAPGCAARTRRARRHRTDHRSSQGLSAPKVPDSLALRRPRGEPPPCGSGRGSATQQYARHRVDQEVHVLVDAQPRPWTTAPPAMREQPQETFVARSTSIPSRATGSKRQSTTRVLHPRPLVLGPRVRRPPRRPRRRRRDAQHRHAERHVRAGHVLRRRELDSRSSEATSRTTRPAEPAASPRRPRPVRVDTGQQQRRLAALPETVWTRTTIGRGGHLVGRRGVPLVEDDGSPRRERRPRALRLLGPQRGAIDPLALRHAFTLASPDSLQRHAIELRGPHHHHRSVTEHLLEGQRRATGRRPRRRYPDDGNRLAPRPPPVRRGRRGRACLRPGPVGGRRPPLRPVRCDDPAQAPPRRGRRTVAAARQRGARPDGAGGARSRARRHRPTAGAATARLRALTDGTGGEPARARLARTTVQLRDPRAHLAHEESDGMQRRCSGTWRTRTGSAWTRRCSRRTTRREMPAVAGSLADGLTVEQVCAPARAPTRPRAARPRHRTRLAAATPTSRGAARRPAHAPETRAPHPVSRPPPGYHVALNRRSGGRLGTACARRRRPAAHPPRPHVGRSSTTPLLHVRDGDDLVRRHLQLAASTPSRSGG